LAARPDYDVAVVGAGPGGAAVARRLIQRDPSLRDRIIVLDRARFPRDKPCGGGLTGHAIDAMAELGFALDVPHVPCRHARVQFAAARREVLLGRPVSVICRTDYDASLVAQVRADGVDVVEGEGVSRLKVGDAAARVQTNRGRRFTAGIVVGADGAASVVRKYLRGGARAVPHRLFRAYATVPAPSGPAEPMTYDFSLMSRGLRGYLWVFPMPPSATGESRVNVGLMHYPGRQRLSGATLKALLTEGLSRHGLRLPQRGTCGWPAWGYEPGGPVSAPRLLTVGDAAGIDALTGEGIGVALEHGVVAGDAIARALATGDVRFRDYSRLLRRATVGRELAVDRWLARLLYGGNRWREWLSLVLYDPAVVQLYADRVAGTTVLADEKRALIGALARHAVALPVRRMLLARDEAAAAKRPFRHF